jgi:hypothetical protein
MKLEDAARVYVEAAPEIRGRDVSWMFNIISNITSSKIEFTKLLKLTE